MSLKHLACDASCDRLTGKSGQVGESDPLTKLLANIPLFPVQQQRAFTLMCSVPAGICIQCRSSPSLPFPRILTRAPIMMIYKKKCLTLCYISRPNDLKNKIS